jgi:hypothetical protein
MKVIPDNINQKKLSQLALNQKQTNYIRKFALKRLDDQNILFLIASNASESVEIRVLAAGRLSDKNKLDELIILCEKRIESDLEECK